ncbi:radical SAM protein, partial [Bacteroides thetaiotaomicron]|uniref:radical SAM protein n=1 Tax=Bacteroides thetaiotaomicron TaxID=818 RepID=UPI000A8ACE4C
FVLCTRGTVRATINLSEYTITHNDFVTVLPGSFIQIHEVSSDTRVCFAGFSSEFISRVSYVETYLDFLPMKISEGCDRKCSYCAIPIITGRHISKSMEEILDEVRYLVSQGVKEFQVIAQELTYYGVDLYKKQMLPELIERISEIPGVEWIRLHYAYPAHFPTDLFRVMRERDNVCKYMDIALQHISDNMLKLMRRQVSKEDTYKLIEQFRKEVPGIHLRTTLMVGHPGETEED